jgi:hypothetical protein
VLRRARAERQTKPAAARAEQEGALVTVPARRETVVFPEEKLEIRRRQPTVSPQGSVLRAGASNSTAPS